MVILLQCEVEVKMNLCLKQHLTVITDKALILKEDLCHLRAYQVEVNREDLRAVVHMEVGVVQDQTQEEVEVEVDLEIT